MQNSHLGTIQLDGDTATGRTYMHELARTLDGLEGVNFAIYHDTDRRTPEGWKFAERLYEVMYVDTTPLGGSASGANGHITAPVTPARASMRPAPGGRTRRPRGRPTTSPNRRPPSGWTKRSRRCGRTASPPNCTTTRRRPGHASRS
ncbi:nuclear transport factor 2 family protein [Streptomyces himalayensis]|uniref:nuclear transport factor 2 family protein n=1 Tax=Streptomyces himalayensis TaxID=2820085 RepID=UPI0028B1A228|nr:nuclear transport factor 2 family protein [Streptomyces himalayensis]